jgi:H+-translocating NAD(P) transhydrogenase subunit alpha
MTPISATDLEVDLLIFILSTALGQELIRHVSRLLHTPLMSLTNAISSVSFIAALIVLSEPSGASVQVMAAVAIALAATNIVSGFLITDRILRLFRRKPKK